MIYLIGSLRNEKIPHIGVALREAGHDIFDDWWGAGPEADDWWKTYEGTRGRSYRDALNGAAACTVFNFDKSHLDQAAAAVLVYPAGKSGHLEFGYIIGQGKPGYILLEGEPEQDRWDLMLKFATGIVYSVPELIEVLK